MKTLLTLAFVSVSICSAFAEDIQPSTDNAGMALGYLQDIAPKLNQGYYDAACNSLGLAQYYAAQSTAQNSDQYVLRNLEQSMGATGPIQSFCHRTGATLDQAKQAANQIGRISTFE